MGQITEILDFDWSRFKSNFSQFLRKTLFSFFFLIITVRLFINLYILIMIYDCL